LLSHFRGLINWEYLLSPNDTFLPTFKKAIEHWGLLKSDNSIYECLVEASSLQMSYALRRFFVTILFFCEPTNVRSLWDQFYIHMVEDYPSTSTTMGSSLTNMLLRDLNDHLLTTIKKTFLRQLFYDDSEKIVLVNKAVALS